ncbi:MAG: restriction endonuclease subunit S [Bacteroidota bacterium]|nr:restriction endonuclease subunit S [Bacteroidota bacterium]
MSYHLKRSKYLIASCLSTWDRAIHTFTQLIQQKQKRKKWLMQVLLSGRIRLPGFSKYWQNLKIRDFASEVSSRNSNDNGYKVLSCTKYDGLVPSLEYFGRKIFSDNLTTYKIVPRNHYAYATNHIEEGSIGYQFDYDFGLISPMYTVFKTDQKVNDDFLFPLLKSHQMIHEYKKRMEGSIDRRGGLRWNTFSGINILLPPKEEQTAIAKVLQTADKEIEILNQKLKLLKAQKKGLMQQLLTGRKRLIHPKNENNT